MKRPMFGKRHYEALAEVIGRKLRPTNNGLKLTEIAIERTAIRTVEQGLIALFEEDNPNFKISYWNAAVAKAEKGV